MPDEVVEGEVDLNQVAGKNVEMEAEDGYLHLLLLGATAQCCHWSHRRHQAPPLEVPGVPPL